MYVEKGKIVIIDDDIIFSKKLKKQVLKYFNEDITIIDFFDWDFINTNKIDLLFLDIELGEQEDDEVNGIEEAIKIRNLKRWDIEIIFITSHSNFISNSFDAGPVYFIDKSELDKRLPRAVEALKRKGFREKKVIEFKDKFIDLNDLIYVSSQKNNIHLHMRYIDGDIIVRATLNELVKVLPINFVRIHKSFIVNMNFIKTKYKDKVLLFDDSILSISRSHQKTFKHAYINAKLNQNV